MIHAWEWIQAGGDIWNANTQQSKPSVQGFQFKGVYNGYDFTNVDFNRCFMDKATFQNCDFRAASFRGSNMYGVKFVACIFGKGPLGNITSFSATRFQNCIFQYEHLKNCDARKAEFIECDFRSARISTGNWESVNFEGSDMRGTNFGRCPLDGTMWEKVTIGPNTKFDHVLWEKHNFEGDKSDLINVKWYRHILNWSWFRFISFLPVLQVSWLVLLLTVFLVNLIELLNAWQASHPEYGIPRFPEVPEHADDIIFSSLLVASATVIYRFFCPDIIKEFSMAGWIYEHNRPRQKYIIESMRGWFWIALCWTMLGSGGIWGLWMLAQRTYAAITYIAIQGSF